MSDQCHFKVKTFLGVRRSIGVVGSVGVEYKDEICTELCLKPWFESDWYFYDITQ